MTTDIDPENVVITEMVDGRPVHLMLVETWDGLYAPIGLRKPDGEGPFPTVLLASGTGGEGMRWIRDAVRNRGYTMIGWSRPAMPAPGSGIGPKSSSATTTAAVSCATSARAARCSTVRP